jgi:hypothetical protein
VRSTIPIWHPLIAVVIVIVIPVVAAVFVPMMVVGDLAAAAIPVALIILGAIMMGLHPMRS